MYQRIPSRLKPGVALFSFWCVTSFFILISGGEVRSGSFFGQFTFWAAAVIVPYTIYSGVILMFNIGDVRWRWRRLSSLSILMRTGLVLLLSVITLLSLGLRDRSVRNYKLKKETLVFFKIAELGLGDLEEDSSPWLMGHLREGEGEFLKLPELILEYFSYLGKEDVDQWGRPYMFVSERREDKIWFGIYSKGLDGVSASKGNDLDDLNTWSQIGFEFYASQVERRKREVASRTLERFLVALAFFTPICFVTFRWPCLQGESAEGLLD